MKTYSPTIDPGDERTRARYLGITTPLDTRPPGSTDPAPAPRLEVLEQQVIRKKDNSEAVLQDLGSFSVTIDQAAMATEYPEVDPTTDVPTGRMLRLAETFVAVHSFIRYHQNLLNAPEPAPVTTEPAPVTTEPVAAPE